MFLAGTPALRSWRRLASTRSKKIFTGSSLWPGRARSRTVADTFREQDPILSLHEEFGGIGELGFELHANFFADLVTASRTPGPMAAMRFRGSLPK